MAAQRKDAARNRAKLIAAAREVFAEQGLEATLDDVAARAGVGTGTAYRNFADKHELAADVLAEATQQIATDAKDALAIADPWQAFATFVETTATRQAADRSLYQALAGLGRASDKVRIWPHIVDAVQQLVDNGKRAGVLRADLEPEDTVALFAMLGAIDDPKNAPQRWRRYLVLLLDGTRANAPSRLPAAADRFESLDDVIAVTKHRERTSR
jgi:AcrR family transcriptional regulator